LKDAYRAKPVMMDNHSDAKDTSTGLKKANKMTCGSVFREIKSEEEKSKDSIDIYVYVDVNTTSLDYRNQTWGNEPLRWTEYVPVTTSSRLASNLNHLTKQGSSI
jgi:hypothetical protein